MGLSQWVVWYGFTYGCAATVLSILAYAGVLLFDMSIIPETAGPAVAIFVIHFVPYYLTDRTYHPSSKPILSRTTRIVRFARTTTSVAVALLIAHFVFAIVVTGQSPIVADKIRGMSMFLVWLFTTTSIAMVWTYGLGVADYLPEWVRRLSRFPFNLRGDHRRGRRR